MKQLIIIQKRINNANNKSMKHILILSFFTFLLIIHSCQNKDKENPTITIVSPDQHSIHKWGETVHINALITDDVELKNYAVFIGNQDRKQLNNFNFMLSENITGSEFDFHKHFIVPNSAPAMAWIYFTIEDVESKTADFKWMLHFEE